MHIAHGSQFLGGSGRVLFSFISSPDRCQNANISHGESRNHFAKSGEKLSTARMISRTNRRIENFTSLNASDDWELKPCTIEIQSHFFVYNFVFIGSKIWRNLVAIFASRTHHGTTSLRSQLNQICVLPGLVAMCIVVLPELRLEKFIGAFGASFRGCWTSHS